MIEKSDSGDSGGVFPPRFYPQCSLARCGTESLGVKPLAHPVGLAQPVKAGGGLQNGIHLPFSQLAQAGVNIAAKLDSLNVRAKSLQLGAAALAAGSHLCALWQFS